MSKVFDYEKAMKVTAHDSELTQESITLFRQQSPQPLHDIGEAVADGDADRIFRAAHAIKGSLANLGGTVAACTAAKLETMGRENNITLAAKTLRQLKREVAEFEEVTADLERATRP